MKKLCNVSIKYNSLEELLEIEEALNNLGYKGDENWNNTFKNLSDFNHVIVNMFCGYFSYAIHNHDGGNRVYNCLNDFIYDYYGLRYKEFFIEYMESFVDGELVIFEVCDLINTHCEFSKCEQSYEEYMSNIKFDFMKKDFSKDFDFRNKYNNMSIRNKVGLKRFLRYEIKTYSSDWKW